MVSGLHFDSLADLPPNMRKQVAAQMLGHPAQQHEAVEPQEKSQNKYHNLKTQVGAIKFDSRKEARRFEILSRAVELGMIKGLRLQQDFTLQEAYTTPEGKRIRAIRYKADFVYHVCPEAGQIISQHRQAYMWFDLQDLDFWSRHSGNPILIIEDVKSRATKTKTYIIKKKLMADQGHDIREV